MVAIDRDRRIARAALRIVLALLLCGGAVLLKRAFVPTERDLGIVFTLRHVDPRALVMDPTGTWLAIGDGDGGVEGDDTDGVLR